MKSKLSRVTLAALFLILLYVPGLAWLASSGRWAEPNLEKRELAELPAFSLSELDRYPGAFEKYYRDHLPFREQLIGLYARVNRALFDDCIVTTVLFGRDGWFFHNNVNDGDLVACFSEQIPEAAIRQIAAAKPLRAVFRDHFPEKGNDHPRQGERARARCPHG